MINKLTKENFKFNEFTIKYDDITADIGITDDNIDSQILNTYLETLYNKDNDIKYIFYLQGLYYI